MDNKDKIVIYQVFPRWFGNTNTQLVKNGSLAQNGVGKFSAFTPKALAAIAELGVSHIWYTGVIEHATKTDWITRLLSRDRPVHLMRLRIITILILTWLIPCRIVWKSLRRWYAGRMRQE